VLMRAHPKFIIRWGSPMPMLVAQIVRMADIRQGGGTTDRFRSINPINVKLIGTEIVHQFHLRVAADPDFVQKSIVEVVFAILMQFTAEVGRRGIGGILPEIDFVIAGILTAIAGKYYSMWKVAKTLSTGGDDYENKPSVDLSSWRSKVPTNAFQDTLFDGKTKPNVWHRLASFILPVPSLFRAGFIASSLGYGFIALLILLRTLMFPAYEVVTVNMNILHASLYTGAFMAIVSNVRYQVLQGIVEPKIIDRFFVRTPTLRKIMISFVRLANGLLGSYLAITGMKFFGLQRLK